MGAKQNTTEAGGASGDCAALHSPYTDGLTDVILPAYRLHLNGGH